MKGGGKKGGRKLCRKAGKEEAIGRKKGETTEGEEETKGGKGEEGRKESRRVRE